MASKKLREPGSSSKKSRDLVNAICTRPLELTTKKGTFGIPIDLQTNYFKLTSVPNWTLNQYRVDISPEEERTFVKKSLLRTHKNKLGAYLFDGTTLFACHALPQPLQLLSLRESDKAPVVIKIRLVATVQYGDYHYFQVFNIIMRKCFEHLKLALVGRNYYNPEQGITIQKYMLNVWPGYISTIGQFEGGVMMCTDISHKVMCTETVFMKLEEIMSRNRNNYQVMFKREVLGLVVITHYNKRTYKITDVDFNTTPSSLFQKRDGTSVQYADYYKEKYNIRIKDLNQPMLVSQSSARERRAGMAELVYLIPELCNCTGITDNMRKDFNIMKALSLYTRMNPEGRIKKLMEFNISLNSKADIQQDLKDWDLQLDKKLVTLQGRIHPSQKIIFGNKMIFNADNGEWDLHKIPKKFVSTSQLSDWLVIVPKDLMREMKAFIEAVVGIAGKMGFNIRLPKPLPLATDHPYDYANAISNYTERYNPQAILCIVKNNQLERYKAIKKKCLIERAIPSQVVISKTMAHKNLGTIACKVAVQLNCKLGGVPWITDISSEVRGLMVAGFDVCHEKASSGMDFGALVSSLDQNFGRYFSSVTHHRGGEELSNSIADNLEKACEEFSKINNRWLPNYIVVYRDGVGEGQVPFVHSYEVKKTLKKLQAMYNCPSRNPNRTKLKFAFIIVTKRINTRIFYDKKNPRPGTVVDDVITNPLQHDFYMVSQNVRQGTVSPSHYNIIENSTDLTNDTIHKITFKLCHMYYNFNGTVRVPAPCQYAHKLAKLTSQALLQSAHQNMQKYLYFL